MTGPGGGPGRDAPRRGSELASVGESLEELYDGAPCGYISSLPDGRIVRVNGTFLRWTGYSGDGLIGRTLQELLTPGGRIYHETHYAPLLRMQGSVREVALDLVCADGRTLPVLMNSVLRLDERGQPAFVRTVVLDATERRTYERELVRARQEAERAEQRARELARTLQSTLIPPQPPRIPGLDIAAAYRPAGDGAEVGGDFFDIFPLDGGTWGLVVGDVEGKGVEAATLTALVRYTLRAAAVKDRRPFEVLRTVNRALRIDRSERFSTVVFATVRPPSGRDEVAELTMASAGHPPPILSRAGGSTEPVGDPGTLLGVVDEPFEVSETTLHLGSGDVVLFYTDGVIEGRRGDAFFGEERLARVVSDDQHESSQEVVDALVRGAIAFQEGVPRDDIAVIAVRLP